MYILGVGQIGGLDSSAVLIKDGELRWAIEEERLTRVKHVGGFPEQAIQRCLREEGITLPDVEHIAIVDRPGLRFLRRTIEWYGRHLLTHSANSLYHIFHDEIPVYLDFLRGAEKLKRESEGRARIHFVAHHDAHMASAFFVSPFEEAAIFTADARGEVATTCVGVGQGRTMKTLRQQVMPHSLGIFYAAITDYLGFRFGEDEYKVMGLAALGEPADLAAFREIIRHDPRRLVRTDLSFFTYHQGRGFFSPKFFAKFGPARRSDEPVTERHQNIAASAQAVLEEIGLAIAKDLRQQTGQRALCLAGGVALNCVMNGKIAKAGVFDQLFVQPAAGDDGGALGAAYDIYHRVLGQPRGYVMQTANLGPEFTNEEIERELRISKVPYRRSPDIICETAQRIADGQIVAWFQGRMEFGPRALGCRSILADPTNPKMKDLINTWVKHREEFRPFAPAVKAPRASEFFEMEFDSPFMLFVVDVREEKKTLLPAITHVDGTARVQSVSQTAEPRFWALLDAFEQIKGVPVLLNTSFNVMGEPIVCTPHEAIRCFFSTGLDALAIGDFLVVKGEEGSPDSRLLETGRISVDAPSA